MNYSNCPTCRRCGLESEYLLTVDSAANYRMLQSATEVEAQSGKGMCSECATKRQQELKRSDVRSRENYVAKKIGTNNYSGDCTLVAIANATGAHYGTVKATAKRMLKGTGIDPTEGVPSGWWPQVLLPAIAATKGRVVVNALEDWGQMTVGQFVASHPKGKYAIRVPGHAMAVKNGKLINSGGVYDNQRIAGAWQVI